MRRRVLTNRPSHQCDWLLWWQTKILEILYWSMRSSKAKVSQFLGFFSILGSICDSGWWVEMWCVKREKFRVWSGSTRQSYTQRRGGGDENHREKPYDTVALSVDADCSDLSMTNNLCVGTLLLRFCFESKSSQHEEMYHSSHFFSQGFLRLFRLIITTRHN
jgi:hypothetical protein